MQLREGEPLVSHDLDNSSNNGTCIPLQHAHNNMAVDTQYSNKKMKHSHTLNDDSAIIEFGEKSFKPKKPNGCNRPVDLTSHQPLEEEEDADSDLLEQSESSLSVSSTTSSSSSSDITLQSLSRRRSSSSISKLRVSFSIVQIQEYSLTLGDHPCADSYPLTLDWPHTSVKQMALKEHELFQQERQQQRCDSSRLTALQRRARLSTVSGIHLSELTRQEQRRQEKLILEQAQQFYPSPNFGFEGYDEEGEGAERWEQVEIYDEYYTDSTTATATSNGHFFWLDHRPLCDDFEPLEVTRSKSLNELRDLDWFIFDGLNDGGSDDDDDDCDSNSDKDSAPLIPYIE